MTSTPAGSTPTSSPASRRAVATMSRSPCSREPPGRPIWPAWRRRWSARRTKRRGSPGVRRVEEHEDRRLALPRRRWRLGAGPARASHRARSSRSPAHYASGAAPRGDPPARGRGASTAGRQRSDPTRLGGGVSVRTCCGARSRGATAPRRGRSPRRAARRTAAAGGSARWPRSRRRRPRPDRASSRSSSWSPRMLPAVWRPATRATYAAPERIGSRARARLGEGS